MITVSASASARELDRPPRATTIAARGDVLAYSRWDDTIQAFRLRVAVGDRAPVDVPVAPRSVPFDVHVGRAQEPDGARRTVLVYSRCRHEPPLYSSLAPEQLWSYARGCSLRVAGLDGGERAIRGAGTGVIPGVSGTTLTFVRFTTRKRSRIIVRRFDRGGPPARILRPRRGAPVDMDLLGERLAVTRRYQGHGEVEDSALDLVNVRSGARRLVYHRNGGGQTGHFIVGASRMPHGGVAWAEICGGDTEGCVDGTELISRWTPHGGLHSRELLGVEAFAATPFATWALQGCDPATYPDSGPCVLNRVLGPVSGRRASNPRPSAWEADALPTELRPRGSKA
jgi:hypothetical protein